jgi:hypothetical protein
MGLGVFPSVRLSSRYRILTMAEIINYFISFSIIQRGCIQLRLTLYVLPASMFAGSTLLNFPSGWKSLAAAYHQYIPQRGMTYELIEALTRLEIWFWDFGEPRLEIIIKVRSGGFYLYFISLH